MTSGMEESMDSLRQSMSDHAEKDELEQRIIAYFEGGLDKEASSSLLADVAKSPAARALFNSHKNLASIISSSRIPLETPLAVKESIAERIPGLVAWIPGLLGTAQLAPIVSQSANPIVAFFTKMSLTTAISVASSVAVLTTAGVIVKNKLDDNAAKEHHRVVAQQQVHPTTPSAEAPQYYSALPQRDLSSPNLGSANGTEAKELIQKTAGTKAPQNATPITKHTVRENAPAMTPAPKRDIAQHTTEQKSAVSTPSNANTPPKEEPPTATISNVAPLAPQAARADILTIPTNFSSLPMLPGEGSRVKIFAALGTRVQLATADNIPGMNYSNDGATPVPDFHAGVSIPLTDALSIRAEVGQSSFAHEIDRTGPQKIGSASVLENYTTVNRETAKFAVAGIEYQLYAADAIPLMISVAGGEVFTPINSPVAQLGLSTELPVMNNLAIRPGLLFDAVFTHATDRRDPNVQLAIDRTNVQKLVSTSLGLSVGISYRY